MRVHFHKYHGTGNDFIIIDNRKGILNHITPIQVKSLCERRFGIGADGMMLLNNHREYDFEMKYFNSDGREGSMCGNGGRCIVQFAFDSGIIRSNYKFIAVDGEHEGVIETNGTVSLKMNDVHEVIYDRGHFILNTGSPHFVEVTNDDVMKIDVLKKGREIRYSEAFKEKGINVNFVEQTPEPDEIIVRTYERGVENETFSCGTGVTAAALVCHHNENGYNHVEVKTKGGKLNVEYDKIGDSFQNIWLIGPATKVFEGHAEIGDL